MITISRFFEKRKKKLYIFDNRIIFVVDTIIRNCYSYLFHSIELTVHVEPPLVLDGSVRDGGVLGPAGQVLAVVVDHRREGQDADRVLLVIV